MADLTVLVLLLTMFAAVLAVALSLPVRLLDWIDAHVLAPRPAADHEEPTA